MWIRLTLVALAACAHGAVGRGGTAVEMDQVVIRAAAPHDQQTDVYDAETVLHYSQEAERLPDLPLIGVTVSRSEEDQLPKVQGLAERTAQLLNISLPECLKINLWDEYYAPRYGEPNAGTLAAIRLMASQEGILLDPVYTGKAMAGLLDGIGRQRFDDGPIVFVHTGGAPALFAYPDVFAS